MTALVLGTTAAYQWLLLGDALSFVAVRPSPWAAANPRRLNAP
ncbi:MULTISPECIES: hypothetical protein [unclassified Streptomyces]|nr:MULTISPECIES: hypothetical protein [unclassified Streptomyces]